MYVYSDNVTQLGERLNELTTNAAVHYVVPDMVPFDRGSTLWPVVYAFIPRFLWRDKPVVSEVTNDHFSIRMGFQTEWQTRSTTQTMPIAAEAYFSFGWPGIFVVGLVCGTLFALLQRLFTPGSRWLYAGTFFVVLKMRPYDGLTMVICDSIKPLMFALSWALLFGGVGWFARGWRVTERWGARPR